MVWTESKLEDILIVAPSQYLKNFMRQTKLLLEKVRHYRRIGIIEDFSILLVASLASFWKLLFSSDIIMQLDLVFPSDMTQYLQVSLQSWNPLVNLGNLNFNADANYPLAWVYYLLSKVGLTPGQIERMLFVGIVFTAGLSMYLLSKYLSNGKRFVALVSAIIFMFNPFVVDNMLWGQVYLQAAYSLIPLVLLCFIIALDRFSLPFAALTGVLLAFVSRLQIQYGYIAVMLLVLWIIATFVREISSKHNLRLTLRNITKSLFTLLIAGSITAVSRLYLVLQVLFGSLTSGTILLQQTTFWHQTIVDASNLIGGPLNTIRMRYRVYSFYQQFEDIALQTWHIPRELLLAATVLFVLLVFASVLFRKRSRSVIWLAIVTLLFAYLSAGTNTPINVYDWLFQHVYGFFIFREPSKFLVCVALGCSYLLGVTSLGIYEFLGRIKIEIYKINSKRNPVRISPAKPLIILVLFLVLWPNMFPLVQGDFGGMHPVQFPVGYENTYNWLKSRPGDFEVLVLPFSMLGHWTAPQLPRQWIENAYAGLPFYNSPPQPIIIQPQAIAMNQGSQRILYYLENLLYTGQVDRLASLLSILGVKYVVVGPMNDSSSFDIFHQSPSQALELLQRAPSLTLSYSSEDFYVFENLKFRGQMYVANASYLAFGNLDLLATESEAGLPALIYGYDLPSKTLSSVVPFVNGIILQGDRVIDYVLQSIDDQYLITLTPYVSSAENNATKSWVLATAYPRPVSDVYALGEIYNPDGFVYTMGSNISLTVPYQIREDSEQQIWIRAMEGPNAGMLQIVAGSDEFPAISLYSQQLRGLQWQLIGSTKMGTNVQKLSIKNLNGTNIIDRMAIIPTEVFTMSYEQSCNSLKDKGIIFDVVPVSFATISGWGPAVNAQKKLEYLGFAESAVDYKNGSLAVTITNTHNTTITCGFNMFVNGANRFTEFAHGPPLEPNQSFTRYYDLETLQARANLVPKIGDLIQIEPLWIVKTNDGSQFAVNETFPQSSIYRFEEKSSDLPVASLNLTVPYSSRFDLFVDAQSTAGTGRLNIIVDNRLFSMDISASPTESKASIRLGPIELDKGVHMISVAVDTAFKANLEIYNLRLIDSSQSSLSKQILEIQPNFDSFTHATIYANNSKPMVMVYSGSYDPGWNLQTKTDNETVHVEINGFANGWFLPETIDTEDQMLNLSFSSQRLLDVTIFVSTITAATVVSISVFLYVRIPIKDKIKALKLKRYLARQQNQNAR